MVSRDYSSDSNASEDQGSFDLLELWADLTRFKLMSGIIIGVCCGAAIAAAVFIKPIYRSTVLLAPATSEDTSSGLASIVGQFGNFASLAGLDLGGSQNVDEAVAILKSRSFTENFVNDQNLMPIFFSEDWDESAQKWDVDPDDIPTMDDAFELFDDDIRSVTEDSDTGLVTLQIEWTNREMAAEWANLLVARLNQYLRQRDIEEAAKSIRYLNEELGKHSSIELRQGIYELIQNQVKTAMLANVRDEYAFRVLDPAVVSDEDNYVWPMPVLLIFFGLALGMFLALGATLVRNLITPRSTGAGPKYQ